MSVRVKRLIADYEKMAHAFDNHPHIRLVEIDGDPPERYEIEYRVKGLAVQDGKVVTKLTHVAEVYLPLGYPRQAPQCRMLSPVYHPNIAPHAICIGDHWSAGESLAALVARIGEMITYQSYNVKSPLNGEAARWAEDNVARLPIQKVDLSVDLTFVVQPSAVPAPTEAAPAARKIRYPSADVDPGPPFPLDEWLAAVTAEIAGEPSGPDVSATLAAVIGELKKGSAEAAVRSFEPLKSIAMAGRLPQVHLLVSLIRQAQGSPDRELAALENSVKVDPTYALAWRRLGAIATQLQMPDKAALARERLIALM